MSMLVFCLFRVIFQFHYDDEIVPLLKIDPLLIFPLQLEVPLLVNVPLVVIPLLVVPLLWIPLLLTPLPLACKSPCWAMWRFSTNLETNFLRSPFFASAASSTSWWWRKWWKPFYHAEDDNDNENDNDNDNDNDNGTWWFGAALEWRTGSRWHW